MERVDGDGGSEGAGGVEGPAGPEDAWGGRSVADLHEGVKREGGEKIGFGRVYCLVHGKTHRRARR